MRNIIIEGKKVNRSFGFSRNRVQAVEDLDFAIKEGEIISIVGESGSGKTTLAKILMGLLVQSSGKILFKGKERDLSSHSKRREYWEQIQAIFQDPFASFNRFYRVETLFKNCFKLKRLELTADEEYQRMLTACDFVNLRYDEIKYKHCFELSGGQMQRIMIARIFLIYPDVLIADEPTSMIDACSRATILNMLMKLRQENNMTIIFITHDVGLAYYISDRIYIMQKGRIVEKGKARQVINYPQADYTRQLLSDVPKLHQDWLTNKGIS